MKLSSLRRNSPYYKKILRLRNCGSDFNKNEALLKKDSIEKKNSFVVNMESDETQLNIRDDDMRTNETNIFISNSNACRDSEDKSPSKQNKKVDKLSKKEKGAMLTNGEKYGKS